MSDNTKKYQRAAAKTARIPIKVEATAKPLRKPSWIRAKSPAGPAVQRLKKVLRDTGDPRIIGEGDIFDTYEYVGWEKASHSWKAYLEGWWKKQSY